MSEIKPLQMIDKDRVVKTLRSRGERITNAKIVRWTLMAVAKFIDDMPTVDAVQVVRCKDCKHRGTDDCPMHIKGIPADEEFLSNVDNDFCSYGERKGGDE